MIQRGVHNHTRAQCKGEEVCDRICCRQVEFRIRFVGCEVERVISLEDSGNVVEVAITIVWGVGRQGEMCEFPYLKIKWFEPLVVFEERRVAM